MFKLKGAIFEVMWTRNMVEVHRRFGGKSVNYQTYPRWQSPVHILIDGRMKLRVFGSCTKPFKFRCFVSAHRRECQYSNSEQELRCLHLPYFLCKTCRSLKRRRTVHETLNHSNYAEKILSRKLVPIWDVFVNNRARRFLCVFVAATVYNIFLLIK
jgi:hypothetical protein